ncbi:MAG: arginine N-succinyltransferase [Myxococcota bacterium]
MIRNAQLNDAESLYRLAQILNTTNLPAALPDIREILGLTCASFEGKIGHPDDGLYVFVLVDDLSGLVIGSSQVIACHGTPELPHMFFQVEDSSLQLGFDTDGYTEIGGLILDPDYRHVPQRLGRALSLIRFKFIQMHASLFKERLIAELLPPMANDDSPLWKALGAHFTNLSYHEADHLSRKDKKFIEDVFPREPIPFDSLPREAQAVIGQVGDGSKPASHILKQLGFRYDHRVDPFDGGPHFEMRTSDLPPIELQGSVSFEKAFEPGAVFRYGLAL